MKKSYDFSQAGKNQYLKRIIVSVKIENVRDDSNSLSSNAFVDTGVSMMMLPAVWKDRFGDLESHGTLDVETSTRGILRCAVCRPVRIQIEGIRPIVA